MSHASAGVLHGLPVPTRELQRVTVLRDGSGSGSITRSTHLRKAPLPSDQRSVIGVVPVTNLPRTVLDLCRILSFPESVAVADAALRRGVGKNELFGVLSRTRQAGNVQARAVIAFADPRSESPGESRCRATIHLAGLPAPELQYAVRTSTGDFVARVDFAWPQARVIGECDGAVKYGALLRAGETSADVLMREKAREERIRRCGWWVVRWLAVDLHDVVEFRAGAQRAFTMAPRSVRLGGS